MSIQLRNWQNSCSIDSILMILLDGQSSFYRDRLLHLEPDLTQTCIVDSGLVPATIKNAFIETMDIIDGNNEDLRGRCVTLRNLLQKCKPSAIPSNENGYLMTSAETTYQQIATMYRFNMNDDWITYPAACGMEWMCNREKPFGLNNFDKDVLVVSNELQNADTNLVNTVSQWIGPSMVDGKYQLYGVVSNISEGHFVSRYIDRTGKWVLADDTKTLKEFVDESNYPLEDLFKWGPSISNIYGYTEKPILWFYKKVADIKVVHQQEVESDLSVDDLFMLIYALAQHKDGRYRNAIMHPIVDTVMSDLTELVNGLFGHLRAYFTSVETVQHLVAFHEHLMNIGGITKANFYNKILRPILFLANTVFVVRVNDQNIVRFSFALDAPTPEDQLVKIYSSTVILSSSFIQAMNSSQNPEMVRIKEQSALRSWYFIIQQHDHIACRLKVDDTWRTIPEESNVVTEDKKTKPIMFNGVISSQRADIIQKTTLLGIQEMISSIDRAISSFGAQITNWSDDDLILVTDGNGILDDQVKRKLENVATRISKQSIKRLIVVVGNRVFLCCGNTDQSNWIYVFDMTDKSVIVENTTKIVKNLLLNIFHMLFPESWYEVCFRNGDQRLPPLRHQLGLTAILLFMVINAVSIYVLDLYLTNKDEQLLTTVAKESEVLGFESIASHLKKQNIMITSLDFSDKTQFWGDLIPFHVDTNVFVQICNQFKSEESQTCVKEQPLPDLIASLIDQPQLN